MTKIGEKAREHFKDHIFSIHEDKNQEYRDMVIWGAVQFYESMQAKKDKEIEELREALKYLQNKANKYKTISFDLKIALEQADKILKKYE